jgi:molybdopterin-guanine dinucleotide biosynthesis protein A
VAWCLEWLREHERAWADFSLGVISRKKLLHGGKRPESQLEPGFFQGSTRVPQISVIVLAGGQSRRLGIDKSLLEIEGQPLIARTVRSLESLSDDLIIVTNEPSRYRSLALAARFVPDERRGLGSLMGIYSGLKTARYSHALAVACDMPFLSLPLLRFMASLTEGVDVVIPRLGELVEPLHSVYGMACLPFMAALLAEGRRKITAFFPEVRVRYVEEQEIDLFDPSRLSFVNVNTPEDWKSVQKLLEAGRLTQGAAESLGTSTRSNCHR